MNGEIINAKVSKEYLYCAEERVLAIKRCARSNIQLMETLIDKELLHESVRARAQATLTNLKSVNDNKLVNQTLRFYAYKTAAGR